MQPGTLLAGRYRLERTVGTGGMGQVWAARDELLGREVAIKIQGVAGGSSEDLERFRREARAAAGVRHPNVVTIFDAGVDGDAAFLVMELLPGPTLAAYVAEHGELPEAEVVGLAEQIAAGLAAAHAAGVVHRDVKPANVMFHGADTVKIVDFGIARLAHTSAARLTQTNAVVGSAPYLSPEQILGRPADERSDIYALGCVLTVMLTGRPPFEGDNVMAVINKHVHGVAPRIRERRPEVSAGLDRLVSDLLARTPDERPPTCRAVTDRLRRLEPGDGAAATSRIAAVPGWSPVAETAPTRSATAAMPVPDGPAQTLAVADGAPQRALPAVERGVPKRLVAVAAAAVLAASFGATVLVLGQQTGQAQAPAGDTPSEAAPSVVPSPTASPTTTGSVPAGPTRQPAMVPVWTPTATAPAPLQAGTDLTQARAELQAAVDAARSSGLDRKEAEDLADSLKKIDEELAKGDPEDAAREIGKTARQVNRLTAKGDLSPQPGQRIQDALAGVRAAL